MGAERGHHGSLSIGGVTVGEIKSFAFKPPANPSLTKKQKKELKRQRARLKVKRNSR